MKWEFIRFDIQYHGGGLLGAGAYHRLKLHLIEQGMSLNAANRMMRKYYRRVVEPKLIEELTSEICKAMAKDIDEDLIRRFLVSPTSGEA